MLCTSSSTALKSRGPTSTSSCQAQASTPSTLHPAPSHASCGVHGWRAVHSHGLLAMHGWPTQRIGRHASLPCIASSNPLRVTELDQASETKEVQTDASPRAGSGSLHDALEATPADQAAAVPHLPDPFPPTPEDAHSPSPSASASASASPFPSPFPSSGHFSPPGSTSRSSPPEPYESIDDDVPIPTSSFMKETQQPEFLTDVIGPGIQRPFDWLSNQRDIITLSYAVLVGGVVAASVFTFDVSIQYIHDLPDNLSSIGIGGGRTVGLPLFGTFVPFRSIMPIGAGFLVAWLHSMGFAPPLKVVTRAVDSVKDDISNAALPKDYGQVFRKAAASAITLGSGASLGPEAPSVELGANTAAIITPKKLSRRRQRMLLAAGAAAGVSAAFDAPVAGALFAVEFVLKSSRLGLDRLSTSTVFVSTSVAAAVVGFLRSEGQQLGISGAASHLVGRIPYFSIQPNLLYDVAQFSLLGVGCAGAAVALYEGVRVSEFVMRPMPRWVSAPLAGALCGIIALQFPQVQYGYINLEEIFRDSTNLQPGGLVALLLAKLAATSVCVGGGLVGGLFAPSLFMGALVGDIVGHYLVAGVATSNTFVVVGAAAVLGASCRAPLTAITLMVEITRDTGLLVPLLAAIGTACLVTDYLEGSLSSWLETKLMEMYVQERTMFWGAGLPEVTKREGPVDAVETAMSVTTNLYVRHSLPLVQAREAMASGNVKAAVVVDDNFSPLGVAYMDDVEEEIVRQRLLNERDSNFGK